MTLRESNVAAPAAAEFIETDALVIGAGPAGLFQVFELGLLELQCHVVDSLPFAGGQCVELYADKPIYDIPGVPLCTGRELTDRLLQQIQPMGAPMHFNQVVTECRRGPDGRFLLKTRQGLQFRAKVVIIAGGVGAFLPRTLKVPAIERFEEQQVFHRLVDASQWTGRHVVVVGGGQDALEAVLRCSSGESHAQHVTLVHRRDVFQADEATIGRLHALRQAGRVDFIAGQVTGFDVASTAERAVTSAAAIAGPSADLPEAADAQDRLRALHVTDIEGDARPVVADLVLVFFGLSPRLGPIAEWGLGVERKQIVVDPARFETSEPGIFAVGDINAYPGKKKLILCGFHEATLAAFAAAAYVDPDRRIPLQYTTTSPQLHRVLGVSTAGEAG